MQNCMTGCVRRISCCLPGADTPERNTLSKGKVIMGGLRFGPKILAIPQIEVARRIAPSPDIEAQEALQVKQLATVHRLAQRYARRAELGRKPFLQILLAIG